jgi:hypothetical protein
MGKKPSETMEKNHGPRQEAIAGVLVRQSVVVECGGSVALKRKMMKDLISRHI